MGCDDDVPTRVVPATLGQRAAACAGGAALGLLAALALLGSGCAAPATLPPDGNVILITVDTLRANFLGCYGHPWIRTPNIDRLAREGIRFARAYSQSHITIPSHLSVLTSLYPKDHGVLSNDAVPVAPGIVTLADALRRAGFRTIAVTSNRTLSPEFVDGLGFGFSSFDRPDQPERDARATSEVFFDWLATRGEGRFFAWLHYFDPHLPYAPPEPYASMYYSGDPRAPEATSMEKVAYPPWWTDPAHPAHRLIAWLDGIRDHDFPVARYAGEITYVDTMIGELLERLRRGHLDRNTLIVLTADHGESLGEHGISFDHASLYEQSTHVPLIMWAPAVLRHPREIDELVMSIDIMPTVLALAGVAAPPGPPGRMQGQSLVPLMRGEVPEGPHRYVFAEGTFDRQLMVRSPDWKYIETVHPVRISRTFRRFRGTKELYDVTVDGTERVNRHGYEPEREAELQAALAEWRGASRAVPASPTAKSPGAQDAEQVEQLRALGYVQ